MSQVGPLIHGFGKGYYRSLLDLRRGCVYKSIQVKVPGDWKPVRKPSFIPSNRQIHVGELIHGSPRRLDRTILKHMFDATTQQWQTFLKSRYQKLIMQINSFGLKQRQEFIPLKLPIKSLCQVVPIGLMQGP